MLDTLLYINGLRMFIEKETDVHWQLITIIDVPSIKSART